MKNQEALSHLQDFSQSNLGKNFVLLGMIGHGTFSEVYKVRRVTDGKIYALKRIKLYSLKPKEQQYAMGEIKILAALDCPYIVSFRQSFYDAIMQELCSVMEWANEGDLQSDIEKRKKQLEGEKQTHRDPSKSKCFLPQSQVWRAVRDILSGLAVLHETSILHRDIKTANIFKSDGVYKLGDLNIAKICPGLAYAYTQTGTPYYASPEVWKQLPYNSKSDIWSFGCVIYEMCQLSPPFGGGDMNRLFESVVGGKYTRINTQLYSKQLSDLIDMCLRTDPKQRKSCRQILSLDWVKAKFEKYNIRDQETSQNESKQQVCQKQLSIKLTRELRQLKTITNSSRKVVSSAAYKFQGNLSTSSYDCSKLNEILPHPNYPSEGKKRILNNKSECFGTSTSNIYESDKKIRPGSCRTQSTHSKPSGGQKRRENINEKVNSMAQMGDQIVKEGQVLGRGRSLLQIGQTKVKKIESKVFNPVQGSGVHLGSSSNQQSIRQPTKNYSDNPQRPEINRKAGNRTENEKLQNMLHNDSHCRLNQRGVSSSEAIKKYKYKYKYKYAYNGVRPSSHNHFRKVIKQRSKQHDDYTHARSQMLNILPASAHSLLARPATPPSAEKLNALMKKADLHPPLSELTNLKPKMDRMNSPSEPVGKKDKPCSSKIQSSLEYVGELPRIRYMLGNRSSNIRQEIGKIYCNQNRQAANYERYLAASGYGLKADGNYRY